MYFIYIYTNFLLYFYSIFILFLLYYIYIFKQELKKIFNDIFMMKVFF